MIPSRQLLPLSIVAIIAALSAGRVVATWDELPPVMASHFGASGRADGFMPRASFFATIAGAWAVVTFLPMLLVVILPAELVNVPHRSYWMAPERRDETLRRIRGWLAWFSVAISLVMLGVLELTIRANRARTGLDNRAFFTLLAGLFVFMGVWLVMLHRDFRLPVHRQTTPQ